MIEALDRELFLLINGAHSPSLDFTFYLLTKYYVTLPIHLLLVYILYKKLGIGIWKLLIFAGLTILCSDQISNVIKHAVQRYRPSHNLEIESLVHTYNEYKGGMYGFVSSHAANMFAVFGLLSFGLLNRYWVVFLFIWACLISYTRIYLGVHYPTDIIGGAILGIGIGLTFNKLYFKFQ